MPPTREGGGDEKNSDHEKQNESLLWSIDIESSHDGDGAWMSRRSIDAAQGPSREGGRGLSCVGAPVVYTSTDSLYVCVYVCVCVCVCTYMLLAETKECVCVCVRVLVNE